MGDHVTGLVWLMVAPALVCGLSFVVGWVLRRTRERRELLGIPKMTDDWANLMADTGKRLARDSEEWHS